MFRGQLRRVNPLIQFNPYTDIVSYYERFLFQRFGQSFRSGESAFLFAKNENNPGNVDQIERAEFG